MFLTYKDKKSKSEKLKLILLIATFPALVSSLSFVIMKDYAKSLLAAVEITTPRLPYTIAKAAELPIQSVEDQSLTNKLKELTSKNANVHFDIAIIDLNNGKIYEQTSDNQIHAASTMKLLVAVAAYQEIEKGNLKPTDSLGDSTVQSHLKLMVNQSNNNSWNLFYSKLGINKIQSLAIELGFKNTELTSNLSSAGDIADLLQGLYRDNLISAANKQQLYSYMQKTETETLLTPGLPQGTKFYHKTGKYGGEMHDGMIVDLQGHPYVIVVFSDSDEGWVEPTRLPIFKEISKTAYEYFSSKQ